MMAIGIILEQTPKEPNIFLFEVIKSVHVVLTFRLLVKYPEQTKVFTSYIHIFL